MTRTTLTFVLSSPAVQRDLLREFALHREVVAMPEGDEATPTIRVETNDSAAAQWDVRATVGMFDDGAKESDRS